MPSSASALSVRDRLERARDAMRSLRWRSVAAVVGLTIAAMVAWGAGWLSPTTAASAPRPPSPSSSSSSDGPRLAHAASTAPTDVTSSSGGTAVGSSPEVVVQVVGAVASPGLVRLPASSRVDDAVRAAGGASPDADVQQLNLAERVRDGARVVVPRRGEHVAPVGGATAPAAGGAPSAVAPGATLDINTASEQELDALPGVGPSTAKAIVQYRDQHGPFRSIDDLGNVKGIGPAKLEQLRPSVTF